MSALQLLIAFARKHDHDPAFQATFLVLTVIAAALLNVGAFIVLVLVHMSLDAIKYHHVHRKDWAWTLRATARESLLDIALLCVALFLAVYFHRSSGLLVLSGIVRFEGVVLGGIAVVLSRVQVLWRLLGVCTHVQTHMRNVQRGIAGSWTLLERGVLTGALACIVLVVLMPLVSSNPSAALQVLREQLIPWNV